jgi:NAD(P)-dependent dehydrogenase (short-subunit alcohol dehydrogenase family)
VRSASASSELQTISEQSGKRVVVLEADTTDPASVAKLSETISKSSSSLDQVIYNAGVLKGFAPITKASVDDFKKNMEVNVYGAHTAAVAFYPFVQQSTYSNKVFAFIGSSFGSVTTAVSNFEMHSQAFGTPGANYTALYDISKVSFYHIKIKPDMLMAYGTDRRGEASFGIRHGTSAEGSSNASHSPRSTQD